MTNEELITLVNELLQQGKELEWLEFKQGDATDAQRLGKYISGLANAANYNNVPFGYLVFGIKDETLDIVGTNYNYLNKKEKGSELDFYIRRNLSPSVHFQHFVCDYDGNKIEIFKISAAQNIPVSFENEAYIRVASSLTELKKYPDRMRAILNSHIDWSAEIVPNATLEDLDTYAIQKARDIYKEKNKNKSFYKEIDNWTNEVFLDKLKVTINGKVTNTALILLGKSEASHLLSPKVAQITWKLDTEEKAYEHFSMPLFLAVNEVLAKIRNVNYKFFPTNQLISIEVPKYDNESILEALNNCIAHQDYSLNSRIIVTEKINKLIFENAGGFFEGNAEDYFLGEKTPKNYRNKWLVEAMVNLNMIDSMGYGIFKMLKSQKERYFPLPDYSKSKGNEVILEIYGHSIDENYSKLLIENKDGLDLTQVILLDRIQKKTPITDAAAKMLRTKGLIDGRKPNYFISAKIAELTNRKAEYTRNKGLDKEVLESFVLKHIEHHGFASRSEINQLLMDKLPDYLDEKQRKKKIDNLLQGMKDSIHNVGSRTESKWVKIRKD
ncbi:RNA-binding domain-containing protein [Empedobacter falsenii]|uniref:RNA-binding domain-containing protein n=2 Tax=Empedobacter TaxID=59734 RepID=UPI001C5A42AC|nr:RNA-binding domain-containing protein [Empedobacter falsenii]MBW1617811.1 transcriptional regulator [Empedobacter falsenii]